MALHVPRDDGRGFHRPLGDERRPRRTCFRPEQHALLRASLDRRGHLRDPVSPTTLRSGRGKRRMESRTERWDATRRRENDNAAGVPLFMYIALPCNHSPLQVPQVSQNTPSSAQKIPLVCCAKLSRKFVWNLETFCPGN